MEGMKGSDKTIRQRSTAVYLIDRLALRVGGEKDTEEEADTVGCCSLRKVSSIEYTYYLLLSTTHCCSLRKVSSTEYRV